MRCSQAWHGPLCWSQSWLTFSQWEIWYFICSEKAYFSSLTVFREILMYFFLFSYFACGWLAWYQDWRKVEFFFWSRFSYNLGQSLSRANFRRWKLRLLRRWYFLWIVVGHQMKYGPCQNFELARSRRIWRFWKKFHIALKN